MCRDLLPYSAFLFRWETIYAQKKEATHCVLPATTGDRAVKYDAFRRLWKSLVPYIVKTRPMTDLCWMCQRNNSAIYHSTNTSNESKYEQIRQQQAHLDKVVITRSLYQEMVLASKVSVQDFRLCVDVPASRDITVHYSFDYAHRSTIPWSLRSLGRCISCAPGSVVCSGSLVKGCLSR